MPEPRFLGVVSALGAGLFGLIVIVLTAVQWPALHARGWHPVRSSDVPYPSALALGRGGWLQVVNFAILGVALLAVAAGFWLALDPPPIGAIAPLALAGAAGVGLMAPTDGSLSSVRTWHGAVHVGSFVTLLISLVLGMLLVGWAVGDNASWVWLELPSIGAAAVVVVLTVISFVLPTVGGLASVASIAAMLVWLALAGAALATGG